MELSDLAGHKTRNLRPTDQAGMTESGVLARWPVCQWYVEDILTIRAIESPNV